MMDAFFRAGCGAAGAFALAVLAFSAPVLAVFFGVGLAVFFRAGVASGRRGHTGTGGEELPCPAGPAGRNVRPVSHELTEDRMDAIFQPGATRTLADVCAYTRDETRWPEPTEPEPTDDELERMVWDSVCDATDGCTVEPDGVCEHGHVSWLLYLGLI